MSLNDGLLFHSGEGSPHAVQEEMLSRRESSLSADSDRPQGARVLGEPISDCSSEGDGVDDEGPARPRPLVDEQGHSVADLVPERELDSLQEFEEQEREVARQLLEAEQSGREEDGRQMAGFDGEEENEMSRIEEEDEAELEEEHGEGLKWGYDQDGQELEGTDEEEEEASWPRDAEELPRSSHSRVSESLQNREFNGAELLRAEPNLKRRLGSPSSAHSSLGGHSPGFPVDYPTDPPPAYSSPPREPSLLGAGLSMSGGGYPVPSPLLYNAASTSSTRAEEESEAEEGQPNSVVSKAIGSSFALAGGMAAAVAASAAVAVPPPSGPAAGPLFSAEALVGDEQLRGVDSPRSGGRRLDSARVVQGARTAAELRSSIGSARGRSAARERAPVAQSTFGDAGPESGATGLPLAGPTGYPISAELKALFRHIEDFVADRVEVEPVLRPFQIDYIPAVGDVDPFIKVPRPDDSFYERFLAFDACDLFSTTLEMPKKNDELLLGLAVLDEPATQQSDSAIVDLRLHQMSGKTGTGADVPVKKLSHAEKNAHQIDRWIQSVKELRRTKAPARVHYSRQMPQIETLMQEWPPEVEQQLKGVKFLLNSNLDADLEDYADLCLGAVDIPLHKSRLESLHLLFTLYAEFRNSQHFRNLALNGETDADRAETAPSTTLDQFVLDEGGRGVGGSNRLELGS